VIPTLTEIAETFGVDPSFVPPAFALLLTALVLFVQAIVRQFQERKS
jgi:hypothetical protein